MAIQISELSKRYQVGVRERYPTLREALKRGAFASLRRIGSWAWGSTNGREKNWVWAL